MPSAVAAFGGIDSQSDQIGNQFSVRIQGCAPQVAMGKRNPLEVVQRRFPWRNPNCTAAKTLPDFSNGKRCSNGTVTGPSLKLHRAN